MKTRYLFLLTLLFITALLSLLSGPIDVSISELFQWLQGQGLAENKDILLSQLRAPRLMASIYVGASLGLAGLILQTVLKNPLAEPYTLGLSGGSSLGALICLSLHLSPLALWIPLGSTLGCFFSMGLILYFSRNSFLNQSRTLILFGMMLSLFLGAVVVTGLSFLSPDRLQTALFWLLGEFGSERDIWSLYLCPIFFICLIITFKLSYGLDVLALGDARALSLGFSPKILRSSLIIICSVVTALAVSISGLVGFIGLVSPHLARLISPTSKHRHLVFYSSLIGAILLTLADSAGRMLTSSEIPAGSLAALFGAPILMYLLTRRTYVRAD